MRFLNRLMRSARAATAIEYGLILAMIFIAAMAAMGDVGKSTSAMWIYVSGTSTEAMAGGGG
ncbi:MAG: Flp family type IVb pilin [Alphaproteobacteria bacterium HGW-Alphaproteobacteria-13]|nr:MAG: Flp family type IVb pilin [Alphaproteobacteria bacterium HGW-Alphaproteobacteria-13]